MLFRIKFFGRSPNWSTILFFGLIRPNISLRHPLSGVPGGPTPSIAVATAAPPLQSGVGGKCMFSIIVLQKYVKKALEWRQETRQKSICAVRTRQRSFKPRSESDTLYPRSAFLTRFLPGMEVLSC